MMECKCSPVSREAAAISGVEQAIRYLAVSVLVSTICLMVIAIALTATATGAW